MGGQPAGLAGGSRWAFRAKGERPPENRVGGSSTPAGCQNLGDVTAAATRPAVLTAITWGCIGLRAFPAAPEVPVQTSAGDDAPPVRRYTPYHLQTVNKSSPWQKGASSVLWGSANLEQARQRWVWHPSRGAELLLRRCPEVAAPRNPRRPPATLWQPFGLTDPECPNSSAR